MESSGCIYASVTIIMIGKETTACWGGGDVGEDGGRVPRRG